MKWKFRVWSPGRKRETRSRKKDSIRLIVYICVGLKPSTHSTVTTVSNKHGHESFSWLRLKNIFYVNNLWTLQSNQKKEMFIS